MGNSNEYQAYCLTDNYPVIDGMRPLNIWNCGSCVKDGKEYAVAFVSWYKDGLIDAQDPHYATIVDFSLDSVEQKMQSALVYAIFTEAKLPAETSPSVAYLIELDRAEGLTPDEIIEKRAGILGDNFLGFTFDSMIAENPWIVQPVKDEEGNEHPNVWKCSLGPTVES